MKISYVTSSLRLKCVYFNYNYTFVVFFRIFEAAITIQFWKNAKNPLFLPKKRCFSKFCFQKNLPPGDWHSPSIRGHFWTTPSSGHSKLSLSMYRNTVRRYQVVSRKNKAGYTVIFIMCGEQGPYQRSLNHVGRSKKICKNHKEK